MLALTDATDLKTSGSLDTDIVRNGQVLHLGGTLRRHNGRRWQWERQKSNSLNRQNKLCTCSMLFCTLLYRHCTTTTGKCLISRFMEDVNKRRAKFLCLSELEYGSWEFGSKRVRLHLKKISHLSWSNHDRDWKNPNSPSWYLKLPDNTYEGDTLLDREGERLGLGVPWRSYLSHTHCFLIPHNLEIPEERTTTSLTDITLRPFWCLIRIQKKKKLMILYLCL